jgi:hypothetical protein
MIANIKLGRYQKSSSIRKKLLLLGMILCMGHFLFSCTAEEMETEPQAVYEVNANNGQTNVDPKK